MASVTVAYILWLFGGIFGLHHLYLGRHGQALIWWLSWGGYVLGWLGDSGRISGYVDEANETIAEKREKLKVLKKHHPKPELSYLTIGSYIMVGHLLSNVIVNAAPDTFLKADIYGPFLTHACISLGTALGVYMITRTEPVTTSFLWPFLAAMCIFPVTYVFPDKQPITALLTTAVGAYVSMACAVWNNDVSEEAGCQYTLKRLAVVFTALLIHGSLWTSFLYFNVRVTSMNGTLVQLREVLYNFMITKPFQQTHDAMMDLYPCMRMYDLETCQTMFIRTLTEASDPTREDWAFKVLEFDDPNLTPRKIHSHCRKLSSKFHPDRNQNARGTEKKEIEKRFLEIQQACGILNKIKVNRERKSKWSVSEIESWSKDDDSVSSDENNDLDNFTSEEDLDEDLDGNDSEIDNEFDEELDEMDYNSDSDPGRLTDCVDELCKGNEESLLKNDKNRNEESSSKHSEPVDEL